MLGEAFGAVTALKHEGFAGGNGGKLLLQFARLACKNERRIAGKLLFGLGKGSKIWICRNLLDRLVTPGIRRPFRHHRTRSKSPGGRVCALPVAASLHYESR